MSPQETFSLIFRSGVSTSPMITDISGRGLGLAIVQEKVEKLGGVISVETEPDSGTTFRVVLPLTLATFRGILLQAKGHLFVMPTSQVERTVNVKNEDIATVENKESIRLNGTAVALVRLEDALGLVPGNSGQGSPERAQAVVVGSAHGRIAFLVDQVTGEQEVLVKTLGKQLSRVRLISGATVLGTGKIALILNVHDLMKSAAHAPGISAKPFPPAPLKAEEKRKSVLVAEDSITARTLLKGILEAAGYDVRTAVDGIDALAQLRSGAFDLLVSDVDMPGMGGLDLTAKIRAERRLSELPVVLVTALESPEDRARGIDVGADAYIVKSDFDQSNLLDVVRRLI